MGYSPNSLAVITDLIGAGDLTPCPNVLELGDQTLSSELPSAAVVEFFSANGRSVDHPENYAGGRAQPLFVDAGCEYQAIDIYVKERCVVLNLNRDYLPPDWVGTFDLVTNWGTTEHVANQYNAFRIMHDSMKVGGICIHDVPFAGYCGHGLIRYDPKFFAELAKANRYQIMQLALGNPHRIHHEQFDLGGRLDAVYGSAGSWGDTELMSGLIRAIFRKVVAAPFAPPTDFRTASHTP